jgi:hypothetical protein
VYLGRSIAHATCLKVWQMIFFFFSKSTVLKLHALLIKTDMLILIFILCWVQFREKKNMNQLCICSYIYAFKKIKSQKKRGEKKGKRKKEWLESKHKI